jgi:uncharacterized protein YcnI
MQIINKLVLSIGALFIGVFSLTAVASAHIVVRPSEVLPGTYQTFNVSVPNERDIAVAMVKVLIPDTIKSATPTVKPGWTITVEKTGEGETAQTTAITWSEGSVPAGQRDDFSFSAKTPDTTGELTWKAYQTYADGVTVAWDQKTTTEDSESTTSGPSSTTNIVKETAADQASTDAKNAADSAKSTARLGLYTAIAALAVGLVVLGYVTKK